MLEELISFTVDEADAGQTVREVLQKRYGVSRRLLIRAKFKGSITRNGVLVFVNEKLQAGDKIAVMVEEEAEETVSPEDMPLSIRYEDEDLMVIAKPAGLVVHPTGNHPSGTLANGMIAYWKKRGEHRKFRAVNRLDKDTSGLMIVAKNQWAHEQFSRMQQIRTLQRTYRAIVQGIVESDEGTIDAPIGLAENSFITRQVRPDGQTAVTHYRVLARGEGMSFVEVKLETGRTHQIRVHMSSEGHPLAGDDLYGGEREHIGRQALHAWGLSFVHPRSGLAMSWEEPLPNDMEQLVEQFFPDYPGKEMT
ncbi:RluA family pseudouridine synthase [Brevibacillus formosus]|uniref:Pseudouridine synthase n=1 Tax=Brevibacillus formosus TaxID=54913 RepID=A0A837KVG3_9BACL|nr:RluA family pseudouridine synthase [Brevibacillus formosus]KLI01224.1 pseudouridine synthase [Brevibacillus formosus]MED1955751.1 RluA family pseudouridine synthase [Brevibacillus formosus]PSK00092.1 RluA family pseudouridine synthase [Brevibacillus formosus]GED59152.1 RNA pseudouridine synthase [Brevibacillus formosus]